MSDTDYTIVVPSRKRTHNMPLIRRLLPSALVCVDEREVDEYRAVVPEDSLLVHPPMDGLWNALNWCIDTIQSPALIEVDDDFQGVRCLVGSGRFIRDPVAILAILENALQATADLGLSTFCFSRTPNALLLRPDAQPIRPVQPVCNAFGILGPARRRKYLGEFVGRGDVDWTLRTLLEDRAVYADCRFYFDCGRVFGGRGGNVGLVTAEQFADTSRKLVEKWGHYVSYKTPFGKKTARKVAAIRINVDRFNPTAQK